MEIGGAVAAGGKVGDAAAGEVGEAAGAPPVGVEVLVGSGSDWVGEAIGVAVAARAGSGVSLASGVEVTIAMAVADAGAASGASVWVAVASGGAGVEVAPLSTTMQPAQHQAIVRTSQTPRRGLMPAL